MAAEPFDRLTGATSNDTFDRTFATGPTARLVLENIRGRVSVSGWDRPEVRVTARKVPGTSSPERFETTHVESEHQGSTVFVRTNAEGIPSFMGPRGDWREFANEVFRSLSEFVRNPGGPPVVDYDVQVPVTTDVEISCVNGDVAAADLRGAVRLRIVSGSLDVQRTTGEVHLRSVSGQVRARALDGTVSVESVSGDVDVVGKVPAFQVKTVSGSVGLTSSLDPTGNYEVSSVSGQWDLRIPPETGASVGARGVNVDVRCDLACHVDEDVRRPGTRRWFGTVNGGGARVRFQSVSGGLHLMPFVEPPTAAPPPVPPTETPSQPPSAEAESGGHAEAVSPEVPPTTTTTEETIASPASPASDDARLAVLRALERGEIGVDEALRRIEDLRDGSAT